jgi:Holliday junction resolvase RusA-like endonuclease
MVIIPGEPKAKARPRMSTKTGRAFTPKETIQYENWVKACYIEQCGKRHEGEIIAVIRAYYSIAKSASKKKRELMINQKIKPTKKPDLDNIAKAILDSLNKIGFDDDSQIVELRVSKYYSEEPRVELELYEVI